MHRLALRKLKVSLELGNVDFPFLALIISFCSAGIIYSLSILYACNCAAKDSRSIRISVATCVVCNTIAVCLRSYRAHTFMLGGLAAKVAHLKWDFLAYLIVFAPVRTLTQVYFGRRALILHAGGGERDRRIERVGISIVVSELIVGLALPVLMLATSAVHDQPGLIHSPAILKMLQALFILSKSLCLIYQVAVAWLFASSLRKMDTAMKTSRRMVAMLTRMQLASTLSFCVLSVVSIWAFLWFKLPSGGFADVYILPLNVMEDLFAIWFLLALLVREKVRSAMLTTLSTDVLSPDANLLSLSDAGNRHAFPQSRTWPTNACTVPARARRGRGPWPLLSARSDRALAMAQRSISLPDRPLERNASVVHNATVFHAYLAFGSHRMPANPPSHRLNGSSTLAESPQMHSNQALPN